MRRQLTTGTGRYEILEALGQGAVATVHRVRDVKTSAMFAGKILHRSHDDDDAAAARFAQEARLLQDVRHENLVAVHGLVEIDGRDVLLMELVEGPDLATMIATEAPIPSARLIDFAAQIARGLVEAHNAGIIHRDLKPSNVLVANAETAKIADFGMARASSIAGVDRSTFAVVGTPDYMPPESLDPLAVDARADLYALGCMMFEMATGRPPYTAATPFGILSAHRSSATPKIPETYPASLRKLVAALMAKSPADRPQSATAVVGALGRAAGGDPIGLAVVRSSDSRCASCAGPLIAGLGVCLGCGMPAARTEPGSCTLLVTGPGKPGDKLDSQLREALRSWLGANPDLGLIPTKALEKKIPRLPFTLARNLSEDSAQGLVRSLERLGLTGEVLQGGPLSSALMRKKVKGLSGRVLLIIFSMWAGLMSTGGAIPAGVLLILGGVLTTVYLSVRSVTGAAPGRQKALPPAIKAALGRVEKVALALEEARHRHGLRAAVSRATDLARDLPPGQEAIADELAQAIDAATVAAGRLDMLDRKLAEQDRDIATEDARALLHERDTWSARLLSLTATLEALQARIARAKVHAAGNDDDDALADLRAQVEALEEVQAG